MLSEVTENLSRTAERLEKMAPQEWMGPDEAAVYLGKSQNAFQKAVLWRSARLWATSGPPTWYREGCTAHFTDSEHP